MRVDDRQVVDVDPDDDCLSDAVEHAFQAEEAGVRAELLEAKLEQEREEGCRLSTSDAAAD